LGYVDVAPGGNSPGHANWLVGRHRELGEDGDISPLCTRHPGSMPLIRDLYGELIDLFLPCEYFHMGADEVRWKTSATPPEKRCPRCKGAEKRDLVLEHWTEVADFLRKRGVRPIMWSDMLDEGWNGGGQYETARILPKLPKDIIIASWSSRPSTNPASHYRKHGFTPWKVQTSFGAGKMAGYLDWSRGQEGVGVALFTSWPWSNFTHSKYEKLTAYSSGAIHCCAACVWNPQAAAPVGWHRLVASQGRHWMKVMQVTEWGARSVSYEPVAIAAACNDTTRDRVKGDGKGWMDAGPERDMRALPGGKLNVGVVAFERSSKGADCIILRGDAQAKPIVVGRPVRGLVFLHAAGASREDIGKLYKRFFRKNRSHYGMPVATYNVRYADGKVLSVPVKLGWHVHFWDCYAPARVMPGARSFWTGFTQEQRKKDPNTPDTAAWTMEWKNPRPNVAVADVTVAGAGTEATVMLLGLTAVE